MRLTPPRRPRKCCTALGPESVANGEGVTQITRVDSERSAGRGQVLERLGRPHGRRTADERSQAFATAKARPEAIESDRVCDLSAANHEASKLLTCKLAGFDDELAAALEQSYGDLTTYRTYPEVVEVTTTLHGHGVEIAIVSDLHFDLRPWFASLGPLDCICGFAISY